MPAAAQQYFDPHAYEIDVPASGSDAITLRAAILALSGGEPPPGVAGVVAFEIVPVAAINLYGGYNRPKKTFKAAVAGGAAIPVSTDGKQFDVSEPLDSMKVRSQGTATTALLILYLGLQSS